MSLLEKLPGRTARERMRGTPVAASAPIPESDIPETRAIVSNSFSVCLYCRGGVPVMVADVATHVTKDGKRFACVDRPVVRPGGGW